MGAKEAARVLWGLADQYFGANPEQHAALIEAAEHIHGGAEMESAHVDPVGKDPVAKEWNRSGMSLKNLSSLSRSVTVTIPGTDNGEKIGRETLDYRTEIVGQWLAGWLGGYTARRAEGGWYNGEGSLVREPVVEVESHGPNQVELYSTGGGEYDYAPIPFDEFIEEHLLPYLRDRARQWSQDCVGFKVDGVFYTINSEGK